MICINFAKELTSTSIKRERIPGRGGGGAHQNNIDFKLDYERPFLPLFAITIYWHWSLKGLANHGHKSTEFTFMDTLLLKEKLLSKDHNCEGKQWHDRPAIVKSNLKSSLVFVKHSLGFTCFK